MDIRVCIKLRFEEGRMPQNEQTLIDDAGKNPLTRENSMGYKKGGMIPKKKRKTNRVNKHEKKRECK